MRTQTIPKLATQEMILNVGLKHYCYQLSKLTAAGTQKKNVAYVRDVCKVVANKYQTKQKKKHVFNFLKKKYRIIQRRAKTCKKISYYKKHVLQGYDNQLYIHEMIHDKHQLNYFSRTKNDFREKLAEEELVTKQISVDLATETFYAFKALHCHPHGTSRWGLQAASEKSLRENGNNGEGGVSIHHVRIDDIVSKKHDVIRVCYPGSPQLKRFAFFKQYRQSLLEFVLKRGKKKTGKRDDGEAYRFTIGLTSFDKNNTKARYVDNDVLSPLLNIRRLEKMEPTLRKAIGEVLKIAESQVKDLYSDKCPKPFSNPDRNRNFGHYFTSNLSSKHKSSFEFLDIFCERYATLVRHQDYMNGQSPGYDYGASYSYVILYNNDLYRVNLIMCTRKWVDTSMRHLEAKKN